MKLITRHTRAPKAGAFIRCPYCEGVSRVTHFAWSALGCPHCNEMVAKDRWSYCDRSEVEPAEILKAGAPSPCAMAMSGACGFQTVIV